MNWLHRSKELEAAIGNAIAMLERGDYGIVRQYLETARDGIPTEPERPAPITGDGTPDDGDEDCVANGCWRKRLQQADAAPAAKLIDEADDFDAWTNNPDGPGAA